MTSLRMNEEYHFDPLSFQKQLQQKQNDLLVAQQKALELTGVNHELQQQLAEHYTTIQTLHANHIDLQAQIETVAAENEEYQRIIHQTSDKYEESMRDLSITREQLINARNQIVENQQMIESMNNDLLHIAKHDIPLKHITNGYRNELDEIHVAHNTAQDHKYEHHTTNDNKYEQVLLEQEIDLENMRRDAVDLQQRNKQLSDQIVELTYSNVHLEKEINESTQQIEEQNALIQYLQSEEHTLNVTEATVEEEINRPIYSNIQTPKHVERQKYFHSPRLKANGSASVTPQHHNRRHSFEDKSMVKESVEGSDLFTVVQTYEYNEYLDIEDDDSALDPPTLKLSPANHARQKDEKYDALEEYLHVTASAIKIKYPVIDTSIQQMIEMVRNVPFYEAYECLNKYMMAKMAFDESEDVTIKNSKSVIIKQKFKNMLQKRSSLNNLKLNGLAQAKQKKVNVPKRKRRAIIKIQRPNKGQKSIIDYDKLEEKLRIHEEKLKAGEIIETVPIYAEKKKRIKLKRPYLTKRESKNKNSFHHKTET